MLNLNLPNEVEIVAHTDKKLRDMLITEFRFTAKNVKTGVELIRDEIADEKRRIKIIQSIRRMADRFNSFGVVPLKNTLSLDDAIAEYAEE